VKGWPELSSEVTLKVKVVPAVTVEGVLTANVAAAATETLIELVTPLIVVLLMSVAVMVWLPGVSNVTEIVPVPPASAP
jgi:hypothetical protein